MFHYFAADSRGPAAPPSTFSSEPSVLRRSTFQRLLLLPAILVLLLRSGCSGGEQEGPKKEIVIGLNPSERSDDVQRNADKLAEMISARVGLPVRIAVAQDYSGLVEALSKAIGKAKDKDYVARLEQLPLPKLLDLVTSAERRAKRAAA